MNRIEIVETLNEYAFDNNIQPVIESLNELLNHKNREECLDLIFMAIASTQMYGFISYLTDEEQQLFFDCDYFRSNSYRGIEIPFYNRGQLSFLYELDQNEKVFFSAPTSFGKTSIVTEYILSKSAVLNNVLFVVPTNSLLEELFEKYTLYNTNLNLRYNISTQPVYPLNGRNILFLTPERFMSLAENRIVDSFDLIVMDETYKIVDGQNESISDFVNHRSLRFRKVADIIAGANAKVIFLSPFTYSLTDSMTAFLSKYNIKKVDRKLEYVKREIIKLDTSDDVKNHFESKILSYQKSSTLTHKAKLLLTKVYPDSSIVYVPNYSKAYDISSAIEGNMFGREPDARFQAFINHIKNNFLVDEKENWAVYNALKKGVGVYISPLPRYIKKEIIKQYENKTLTALIVTSAFTEGVNTCASNLIFTSLVNGPNTNKLSDIDVLNVAGRAGRFSKNTVGRIFCINNDIYERVVALQKSSDIRLENYNYKKISSRLDFEIEMIDSEYLDDSHREELSLQQLEMNRLGLTKAEMNISLNVSNKWKIVLYKYFLSLDDSTVKEIGEKIKDLYESEGERIEALSFVFKDIAKAFSNVQINAFPQEPYDIHPFDKNGDFVWGRLYQIYVSGSPKQIIANNIKFISSKFSEIANGHNVSNKAKAEIYLNAHGAKWMLKYFNNDLSLNMNAFYSETFKIVSNIIQYKIPFYLTFYVSIYKLFVRKNNPKSEVEAEFDINKLINIFEEGDTSDEYARLIDYGLPLPTVTKISDSKITLENLKNKEYDQSKFDDYERIIIEETMNLL